MEKPISNTLKALPLDFLNILPRFLQEIECIFLETVSGRFLICTLQDS